MARIELYIVCESERSSRRRDILVIFDFTHAIFSGRRRLPSLLAMFFCDTRKWYLLLSVLSGEYENEHRIRWWSHIKEKEMISKFFVVLFDHRENNSWKFHVGGEMCQLTNLPFPCSSVSGQLVRMVACVPFPKLPKTKKIKCERYTKFSRTLQLFCDRRYGNQRRAGHSYFGQRIFTIHDHHQRRQWERRIATIKTVPRSERHWKSASQVCDESAKRKFMRKMKIL